MAESKAEPSKKARTCKCVSFCCHAASTYVWRTRLMKLCAVRRLFGVMLSVTMSGMSRVQVGDLFPSGLTLDRPGGKRGLGGKTLVDLDAHFKGKQIILMGLPGAFTPT